MSYNLMFTLPDGHRLFSKEGHPGFLIADESGDTPEYTDDGELFLDTARNLLIDQETDTDEPYRIETHCMIPLRTAHGAITSTPTNPATIMHLAITFEWKVTVRSMSKSYDARVTKA